MGGGDIRHMFSAQVEQTSTTEWPAHLTDHTSEWRCQNHTYTKAKAALVQKLEHSIHPSLD